MGAKNKWGRGKRRSRSPTVAAQERVPWLCRQLPPGCSRAGGGHGALQVGTGHHGVPGWAALLQQEQQPRQPEHTPCKSCSKPPHRLALLLLHRGAVPHEVYPVLLQTAGRAPRGKSPVELAVGSAATRRCVQRGAAAWEISRVYPAGQRVAGMLLTSKLSQNDTRGKEEVYP